MQYKIEIVLKDNIDQITAFNIASKFMKYSDDDYIAYTKISDLKNNTLDNNNLEYYIDRVERLENQKELAKKMISDLSDKLIETKEYSHWFGEIMAIMHGDGGHYLDKHGAEKSTKDAVSKYHQLKNKIMDYEYNLKQLNNI